MPKKTKAIKKTDISARKPWLKKSISSSYEIETRELNKTILIVCEGQTEKLYFESFPVLTLTVETINLGGQSKLKLIEATKDILENSDKNYDEIWCVFDMDVRKGEKEFADYDNAINQGQSKGYNVAYSNDAFELWFYLHYQYTDQKNHRSFYFKALSKFWELNYEDDGKSYNFCKSIYQKLDKDLRASQDKAMERAEIISKPDGLAFSSTKPYYFGVSTCQILKQECEKVNGYSDGIDPRTGHFAPHYGFSFSDAAANSDIEFTLQKSISASSPAFSMPMILLGNSAAKVIIFN
ncbi:MAG: RloB family protein [Cyclobacteriaceae bacterium]